MKILIVDDDADVCRLIAVVLARHGYAVLTASSAKAARAAATKDAFDVLISAINMEGGAVGIELARDLAAHRPGLRIVLMSGSAHEINLPTRFVFLQKPFSPVELLQAVGR